MWSRVLGIGLAFMTLPAIALTPLPPMLSTDTHPIYFSINGVHLHAPRNYLAWLSNWNGGPQTSAKFWMQLPEGKPFKEEYSQCGGIFENLRPSYCHPFIFGIAAPRDEGTADAFLIKILQRWNIKSLCPLQADSQNIIQKGIRFFTERSSSLTALVYSCNSNDFCEPQRNIVSSGLEINYSFHSKRLPEMEAIDVKIHQLLKRFIIAGQQ